MGNFLAGPERTQRREANRIRREVRNERIRIESCRNARNNLPEEERSKLNKKLIAAIESYNPDSDVPDVVYDVIRALVSRGADPNAIVDDKRFFTVLHLAAKDGKAAVVRALMSPIDGAEKANVDNVTEAKGWYLWTPLHHAAYQGKKEAAEELLKAGADKDAVTWYCDRYQKPLQLAEIFKDNTYYQPVIQLLRNYGTRRRLIAQTPEPLVEGAQLTSNTEISAIAENSHVPTLLFVTLALLIGYLFYRCVKARRTKPRPLAYPLGLLGGEVNAKPTQWLWF